MRCYACDHILKPSEATRKFKNSGVFTDLCNQCLSTISDDSDFVETVEGAGVDDVDDEDLFDDDGNPV